MSAVVREAPPADPSWVPAATGYEVARTIWLRRGVLVVPGAMSLQPWGCLRPPAWPAASGPGVPPDCPWLRPGGQAGRGCRDRCDDWHEYVMTGMNKGEVND
jgi:hypothetical protein